MSEYQYYEFHAIDRPLTKSQMTELRALTSRATITPSRLVNVYHWGDFRGDPLDLMERYFDAFVYMANWGTRQFMVRLPRGLLDPQAVRPYAISESVNVHLRGDAIILELRSEEEDPGGWIEDDEAAGWMPSLLPLRSELAGGDLRALYLAWLAAIQERTLYDGEYGEQFGEEFEDERDEPDFDDDLDDSQVEPPVPPGLRALSASLKALAEYLRVDSDLLTVAAERSSPAPKPAALDDLNPWIAGLPVSEKDDLLIRLVRDGDALLRVEILRRFSEANAPRPESREGKRTIAELRSAARQRAEERRRKQAEEEAAARATYLDGLAAREPGLWREVETLIEAKRTKEYDQAVLLLRDLRDLSIHRGRVDGFADRLRSLREQYAKRPGLIDRLHRAGLGA